MGQAPISGCHKHQYANGDLYEGYFEDSQRHDGSGNAKMTYHNGDTYQGAYFRDKCHGHGSMTYNYNTQPTQNDELPAYIPNDPYSFRYRAWHRAQQYRQQQQAQSNVFLGTYNGFWLSDKRNAFGTFAYSNDDVYYGEWSNDARQGRGMLVLSSLDEYEGQYTQNKIEGWGVMKLNCINHDNEYQSIELRKNVLKYQVMAHLYSQLQKQLPNSYRLPATLLLDGIINPISLSTSTDGYVSSHSTSSLSSSSLSLSTSTSSLSKSQPNTSSSTTAKNNNNKDLQQYIHLEVGDILAFLKPTTKVQQTQLISQLLDYTIQSQQSKQMASQRYDTLLYITHGIEIEGFWFNNQLSGPIPQTIGDKKDNNSNPTKKSPPPPQQQANLDGFCIIRKYTQLDDHNSQDYYQLQQELQQQYHAAQANTSITKYAMILSQQGVQYICEIHIVPVAVARRVVETYGKIGLDILELEIAEEMHIDDGDFDDVGVMNTTGDNNNNNNNNSSIGLSNDNEQTTPTINNNNNNNDLAFTVSFRSPQKQSQQSQPPTQSNSPQDQLEDDFDRQLAALDQQQGNTTPQSNITPQQTVQKNVVPSLPHTTSDMYNSTHELENLAPVINFLDSDDDNNNGNNNDDGDDNNDDANGMKLSFNPNGDVTIIHDDDDDENDNGIKTQMLQSKVALDAMSRVDALLGQEDYDSGDLFAIGDDE